MGTLIVGICENTAMGLKVTHHHCCNVGGVVDNKAVYLSVAKAMGIIDVPGNGS
jgi:seryl-tRNA(Sec) selenium transferase